MRLPFLVLSAPSHLSLVVIFFFSPHDFANVFEYAGAAFLTFLFEDWRLTSPGFLTRLCRSLLLMRLSVTSW